MSPEQVSPDHSAFEAALATLVPADVQIDRDRLVYLAGMQAANRRRSQRLWHWRGGTVAVVLVALVLAGVWGNRGELDDSQLIVEKTAGRPANVDAEIAVATRQEMESEIFFSPIANVDGWNIERLNKEGITIEPWKHGLQGEYPPHHWVRIRFDCSKLPANQDVLMTASFLMGPQDTGIVCRDVRRPEQMGHVSILCGVRDEYLAGSGLTIYIWSVVPKEKSEHGETHEAHGYHLSMKRIVELAREKGAISPPAGESLQEN